MRGIEFTQDTLMLKFIDCYLESVDHVVFLILSVYMIDFPRFIYLLLFFQSKLYTQHGA